MPAGYRVEALGAVPLRASVGHRPRGLLRRTATPGTTSRTITRAAAPTAGARTASPASPTTASALCFALALWNGRDPILKERLFGLTDAEGNHGEDVKEYYFYLDATPTHSYLKCLYKYPQAAFPYGSWSRRTAAARAGEPEFELARHGRLRRRPLLRRLRRVRQGGARRPARAHHRRTTAGPKRRRLARPAARSGSATRGRGEGAPRTGRCARADRGAPGTVASRRARHARRAFLRRPTGTRRELLFTENETNASGSSGSPNAIAVRRRTPSTRTSSTASAPP